MAGNSADSGGLWLVTGANGFVGRAFCDALDAAGIAFRAAVRNRRSNAGQEVALGDFAQADWRSALNGVSTVFHLAARVHIMKERAPDPLAEFRRANVEAALRLAEQAAAAGVRRFVLLSTVKVLGEETTTRAFNETSPPAPQDAYAQSKAQAEEALAALGRLTGMEVIVLRVPLVYGPGVRGNFLSLLDWVWRGLPLPLASIQNRRSLLYLGNLCDALIAVGRSEGRHAGHYLLADGEDFSTPDLLRGLAAALGKRSRLLPCPPALLLTLGKLVGQGSAVSRLAGSLAIDARAFAREFKWTAPCTLAQGLAETAAWYRRRSFE